MLSYQHQFHAGNHADVLKHWLLVECIRYTKNKEKPFDYIDTHAGAGLYQLNSSEALKTGESANGVLKLNWSSLQGMESYREIIETDLKIKQYPGSPEIINRMLRSDDHSWLFELHPQTIDQLRKQCARKRQTYVQHENGFDGLLRLLPTKSRRTIVLVDPSYEVKSDYQHVVDTIQQAWKKSPQTMFLLWYPVVDRSYVDKMERRFKQSAVKNVQLFEMGIADSIPGGGMNASGMIIVNPPWVLADRFKEIMPTVSAQLAGDGLPRIRFTQLAME